MRRLRVSPTNVSKLKPVARISAMALGSALSAYFGPLGAYTGFVLATVFGDVISDLIAELGPKVIDEIEESIQKELEEKFALTDFGSIALMAYKNTLNELEREYITQYYGVWGKIKKPEDIKWFDCVRKRLDEKLSEQKAVIPQRVTEFDEREILEFILSLECDIDERLRTFLEKRFVEVLTENLIKTANMNDNFRVKFDIAVLEALKENYRDLKKVEKYLKGLRNIAELNISGIEGRISERVEELLNKPFKGREEILEKIGNIISTATSGKIIITGPAGIGKSTLMAHIVNELSRKKDVFVVPYFFDSSGGRTEVSTALRFILAKLYLENMEAEIEGSILNFDGRTLADTISGLLLKKPKKKTVIIIDALDEADAREMGSIGYPFPRKMPENVYLIISVRGDSENLEIPGTLQMVKDWTDGAEIIELKNLGFKAVRALVKEKLELESKSLEEISREIYKKTSGHPLYLKFLLEELEELETSNMEAIFERIREIPESFEEYLDDELVRMENLIDNPEFVDNLFALLAIIKEPMELEDIGNILGVRKRALKRVPHEIKRWLQVRRRGSEEYWSLQHEALRENFARLLSDEIKEVTENLLCFCSRWEGKEYCIRHYPEHLYEAGRYDELLELIKSQRFLEAQKGVGGTPLVFRTLESAMDAAVAKEDLAELFEVVFVYNRVYNEANKMSLLEHYRRYGLEDALILIEKEHSKKRRYNLYLLLSSFLESIHKNKDAKYVVEKALLLAEDEQTLILELLWTLWENLEDWIKVKILVRILISNRFNSRYTITSAVEDILISYLDSSAKLNSNELDKLLQILEKILKVADSIEESDERYTILGDIAISLVKLGKIERALNVIAKIDTPNYRFWALEGIVKTLVGLGKNDMALQILNEALRVAQEEIWSPDTRFEALSVVTKILVELGEYEKAWEILNKLSDKLDRSYGLSDTYWALKNVIVALVKLGDSDTALQIVRKFSDPYYSSNFLRNIAEVLVELGKNNEALQILEESLEILQSEIAKREFFLFQYFSILDAIVQIFVRLDRVDRAFNIVKNIEDPYYRSGILLSIVKILVNLGRFEDASQIIETVFQIIQDIDPHSTCYYLALGDVVEILVELGKNGKALQVLDDAIEIAWKVENIDTRSEILGIIAKTLAKIGSTGKALQIIQEIIYNPDRSGILRDIVEILVEFARFNDALQVLEILFHLDQNMESKSDHFNVLRGAIRILVRLGKIEEALQMVKLVENSYFSLITTFVQISHDLIQEEEFDVTLKILEEVMESARDIKDISSLYLILTGIAEVSTKLGGNNRINEILNDALELAQRVGDPFLHSEILMNIAIALAEIGQVDMALDVTRNIEDLYCHYRALEHIATSLLESRKAKKALRVLYEALQIAQEINYVPSRFEAFRYIAEALSKLGRVEEALEITWRIEDPYYFSTTLAAVVRELAKLGKINMAIQLSREIKIRYYRFWALKDIFETLVELGENEKALQVLDDALKIAQEIGDPDYRFLALKNVAVCLAKLDNTNAALKIAKFVQAPLYQAEILGSIAKIMIDLGNIEHAQVVLEKALQSIRILQSLQKWEYFPKSILEVLVKLGKVDISIELVKKIEDPSSEYWVLKDILMILVECGEAESILKVIRDALEVSMKIQDPGILMDTAEILGKLMKEFDDIFIIEMISELLKYSATLDFGTLVNVIVALVRNQKRELIESTSKALFKEIRYRHNINIP